LHGLLTESLHTRVAGCTTTVSSSDGRVRELVLTDNNRPFAALLFIEDIGNNRVSVCVETTDEPMGGSQLRKQHVATQLARVAFGAVAPYVFDGRLQQQQQERDETNGGDDGGGGAGGGNDLDDVGEGTAGGGAAAAGGASNCYYIARDGRRSW